MNIIPRCQLETFDFCEFVINDVVENVRKHFLGQGLDEVTLQEIKGWWKEILLETKAVEKFELQETVNNQDISKPAYMNRTVVAEALAHTVTRQVYQNPTDDVQNQNFNLTRAPGLAMPANQVNKNVLVMNWLQENRNPVQIQSQRPQMASQVSGQQLSQNYLPTMQTISGVNNQHRVRNSYQIQNPRVGNYHVRRAQNARVRVPVSGTTNPSHQNVIVRQLSNASFESLVNNQNSYRYRQGMNRPYLTINRIQKAQNFNIRLPTSGKTNRSHQYVIDQQRPNTFFISPVDNQNSCYYQRGINPSDDPSGVIVRQPFKVSFVSAVYHKNYQKNINLPFLTTNASGYRAFGVVQTSSVTSPGNLNEISQPVGQDNLNTSYNILQADGADDDIDDEEFSSTDSNLTFEEVIDVSLTGNDYAVQNTNEVNENDDSSICSNDYQSLGSDNAVQNTNEAGENVDDELEDYDDELEDYDDELEDNNDEPPLNSDDDVSMESATELFHSDNVIICQYENVTNDLRKGRKARMYLRNGCMFIHGKEYVFKSAFAVAPFHNEEYF